MSDEMKGKTNNEGKSDTFLSLSVFGNVRKAQRKKFLSP
jgi:hypothetical protein